MTVQWRGGKPPKAGYYLTTRRFADGRHITHEGWYNPSNGWWSRQPGHRHSENTNDQVVAWANLPDPSTEVLVEPSEPRHLTWYDRDLHGIAYELVFDRVDLALELLDSLRERLVQRRG